MTYSPSPSVLLTIIGAALVVWVCLALCVALVFKARLKTLKKKYQSELERLKQEKRFHDASVRRQEASRQMFPSGVSPRRRTDHVTAGSGGSYNTSSSNHTHQHHYYTTTLASDDDDSRRCYGGSHSASHSNHSHSHSHSSDSGSSYSGSDSGSSSCSYD